MTSGPIIPSTVTSWSRWNSRTARSVMAPGIPSIGPSYSPIARRRSCTVLMTRRRISRDVRHSSTRLVPVASRGSGGFLNPAHYRHVCSVPVVPGSDRPCIVGERLEPADWKAPPVTFASDHGDEGQLAGAVKLERSVQLATVGVIGRDEVGGQKCQHDVRCIEPCGDLVTPPTASAENFCFATTPVVRASTTAAVIQSRSGSTPMT